MPEKNNNTPRTITLKQPGIPPFRLKHIPAGTFQMGDDNSEYNYEKPAHPVSLNAFYMAEFPVTQDVYEAVTGKNPSRFKGKRRPVERVSWFDAVRFCNVLSEMEGFDECYKMEGEKVEWLPGKNGFRLPTEAEWEYAARSNPQGQSAADLNYAGSDKLHLVGWYIDNSHSETKDVGLKFPNQNALFDMSGNVWEWCWDWFDDNYYSESKNSTNPTGPSTGSGRILRGGSWDSYAQYCRSANRYHSSPARSYLNIGFRLCRTTD